MGFFSYLCAKSGESIPAQDVEPTEVVGYRPDGSVVQGVYDGYGRIGEEEFCHPILFKNQQIQVQHLRMTSHTDQFDRNGEFSGREFVFAYSFRPWGSDEFVQREGKATYGGFDNEINDPQLHFENKKGFIERSLVFDEAEKLIKIVKAKYSDNGDSFDNLPTSQNCPYQGYFYDDDYCWDEPDESWHGFEPKPAP